MNYIQHFLSNIKRDNIIVINDTIISIDIHIVAKYTTYFSQKNDLIVDNVYSIPFENTLIMECFDHIHTLLITLENSTRLFELLKVFDFLCIDVKDIYESICKTSYLKLSFMELELFTFQALEVDTPLSLHLIDMLYDLKYISFNQITIYNTKDISVLLFLLSRKWIVKHVTKDEFVSLSYLLEFYLYQSIDKFCQSNEIDLSTSKQLFDLMIPSFLTKDMIGLLTNSKIGLLLQDRLLPIIFEKYELFAKKTVYQTSRLVVDKKHVSQDSLLLHSTVQVLDSKKKWYNATIISVDDDTVVVHFDNFTSKYDERINKKDTFRFFPRNTLDKDKICTCERCILYIFS